jgi:histidine ammonia-lyase
MVIKTRLAVGGHRGQSRRHCHRMPVVGAAVLAVALGHEAIHDFLAEPRPLTFEEDFARTLPQTSIRLDAATAAQEADPAIWERHYDPAIIRTLMLITLHGLVASRRGPPALIARLAAFLNANITPLIPNNAHGLESSEGTSDPVTVLVEILQGRGAVAHNGQQLPASHLGLTALPDVRQAEEFLRQTLSVSASLEAVVNLFRMASIIETAEVSAAMTREALLTHSAAFDEEVQLTRPHPGQIESARVGRALVAGSALIDSQPRRRQDAYSLPSILHGNIGSNH